MALKEQYKTLKIITGESSMYRGTPLYEAVVYAAKKSGMNGATVYRGIMSFGKNSKIRSFKFFALSQDLPVIIEITDTNTKISNFTLVVEKMVAKCAEGTLITTSDVNLILPDEKTHG